LPPGEPGGGITGVVVLPFLGGLTVMPGSTFGGLITPPCCDSRLLGFPSGGTIFSAGAEGTDGGATGIVGLAGDAPGGLTAGGVCATAGTAVTIITARTMGAPVRESMHGMI
jgi:hypothetical protein